MELNKLHTYKVFPHYVLLNALVGPLIVSMYLNKLHIYMVSPHYVFLNVLLGFFMRKCSRTYVTPLWFISSVSYKMLSKGNWPLGKASHFPYMFPYRLESGDLITLSFIVKFTNFRALRDTSSPQEGIIVWYFLNVCSMNCEMSKKKKNVGRLVFEITGLLKDLPNNARFLQLFQTKIINTRMEKNPFLKFPNNCTLLDKKQMGFHEKNNPTTIPKMVNVSCVRVAVELCMISRAKIRILG